jgi:hypothetical protein
VGKYTYNKHRKRKLLNGSIVGLDNYNNPCAEIVMQSDVYFVDYASRLETPNEVRRRHGHHAAGITIGDNPINIGQIRQATALSRPGYLEPAIQAGISSGIQPTFSNVYRRGNESFQDTLDRVSRPVVSSGYRRLPTPQFAAADGGASQRDNSERSQGTGDHPSLAAEYMLNSIRNGDVPQFNSEETTTRH